MIVDQDLIEILGNKIFSDCCILIPLVLHDYGGNLEILKSAGLLTSRYAQEYSYGHHWLCTMVAMQSNCFPLVFIQIFIILPQRPLSLLRSIANYLYV